MDNLSLGRIIDSMNFKTSDYIYDSYMKNYLYALIFWDDIYAVGSNRLSRKVGDSNKDLQYDKKLCINRLNYCYMAEEECAFHISSEYEREHNGIEYCASSIKDVIFYLLLGHNLGINVFMSDERTEYLKKLRIDQKIFSRVDILDMLDKEVAGFYQEMNKRIEKDMFSMKMPILIDFISKNSKNFDEAKELALKIKKNRHVSKFRKNMDFMDKSLNDGNIVKFREYINMVPEIINEIDKEGICTESMDVDISLTPSVTIPINMGKLCSKFKRRRMLNMNFLFDLAEYGMKGKKIKI